MCTVAVLGLGKMGSAMAARLLASGHSLHLYNRTSARAASLVRKGAQLFATPAQACTGVDAIICMVADDPASQAIWSGAQGVLAGTPKPNAFAVECSTLSHAWVLELATKARAGGLRYIDAPVTGLPDQAAAGELTLLVGAATADLAAAREVLDALSQRIIHFGAIGTGTAYKLIINMLGAVQIASVAESMAIAERAGLDLRTVAQAIATGQAASPQVVRSSQRIAAGDYRREVVFTPHLRLKDVRYALQLTQSMGIGAPFGSRAEAAFRQLCQLGFQETHESSIMEVARLQMPAEPDDQLLAMPNG
ncbi:MAG TPA: NAD(P)-dependent oxidoreductase [Steroidobacteraceae bacterium]